MSSNNSKFYIKYQNHYKLYVDLKDQIIFESELNKNSIDYYYNLEEQKPLGNSIRYFILDTDKSRIDDILTKSKIVASSGNYIATDFQQSKKIYKLVLLIIISIVLISLFAVIVTNFFY